MPRLPGGAGYNASLSSSQHLCYTSCVLGWTKVSFSAQLRVVLPSRIASKYVSLCCFFIRARDCLSEVNCWTEWRLFKSSSWLPEFGSATKICWNVLCLGSGMCGNFYQNPRSPQLRWRQSFKFLWGKKQETNKLVNMELICSQMKIKRK